MLSAFSKTNACNVFARDMLRPQPGVVCPSCGNDVVLKRGRIRIPHFAHRADCVCPESAGETERHRECKQAIYDALCAYTPMAYQVALEKRYPDRGVRADVFANIRGTPVAIELQRSNLSIADLERRTRAYTALGIAVLWIVAHLNPPAADRYAPRDWERWLCELYGGRVYYWMRGSAVVPVAFEPYTIEVPESSWGGGYSYPSKRFVTPRHGPTVNVLMDFARVDRHPHAWRDINYPHARLYVGNDATYGAIQWHK